MRDETPRSEPRARMRAWVLGTVDRPHRARASGRCSATAASSTWWASARRSRRCAAELEALRAENARLSAEIADLRTNPRAIERLAREELGLARPDETVFLIREAAPGDAP